MSHAAHHVLRLVLVLAVSGLVGFVIGAEAGGDARSSTVTTTISGNRCTWGASSLGPVTVINGNPVAPIPMAHTSGCVR